MFVDKSIGNGNGVVTFLYINWLGSANFSENGENFVLTKPYGENYRYGSFRITIQKPEAHCVDSAHVETDDYSSYRHGNTYGAVCDQT